MIGCIIGDIAGSKYEFHNHKSKEFPLLGGPSRPTDDTVMSLAIATAILESKWNPESLPAHAIEQMQHFGRLYPHAGYGGRFRKWLMEENPQPYNSWGNGAVMRVSPCGFAASTLEEAKVLSAAVTAVTHGHPEALKGAEAVACLIFLARQGKTMQELRSFAETYYPLDFTLDEIRSDYIFDVSTQGSTPQALEAFFESTSFEDAIRNAISIGGDSDTIAAVTGGIAEAYWGVPTELRKAAEAILDPTQLYALHAFERAYEQ